MVQGGSSYQNNKKHKNMATKKVLPVDLNLQPILAAQEDTLSLLKRLAHLLEPMTVVDTARRQRITVDSGTITIGSGTVTTLTNFNQSTDSTFLREMHRTNYNTGVRNFIVEPPVE